MRSAIILAGGKGKRIGGYKHLRKLQGKPLILHVVERASSVAEEIVVVLKMKDDPGAYPGTFPERVRIVMDTAPSDAPLVGIMTGARAATSEYSVLLSCDLAFLNTDALSYLFDQAVGLDAVIPQWPNGRFEPLHAVYRTEPTANAAQEALRTGDYRNISVAKRLQKVKYIPVDEFRRFDSELLTFFNVNSAEDLDKAEKLAAQMRK